MRATRFGLAVVLATGMVGIVSAQPGGGFGFGGFGGNDTTALVLTNKALQEELKITDTQKEKLKEATAKQTEATKKIFEGMKDKFVGAKGDKDKLKEMMEDMQKEQAKITADMRKAIDAELTSDQKKRLKQISVQALGLNVFKDPEAKAKAGGGGFGGFGGTSTAQKALMKEVQESLNLSAAQKTSIKAAVAEFEKDQTEIYKEAGINPGGFGGFGKQPDPEKLEAANKKIEKSRKEAWVTIEEALDAEQKKTWKDTIGDAFDTSKLRTQFVRPKKD
ncbi:MAG: hypothetical protein FJ304_14925 [Planctomycetes bacterium]|nr:hypothetical protein [Planctomycetota bacterium]